MFSEKDKKSLVVQSNTLIEQPYKLSAKEQILIRWLISKIQLNDDNFKLYRLKISEYMRILGIKNGNEYQNIKNITRELQNKGFTIKKSKGELQVNWFASAEYFDNEGIVEIELSSKLKPYLLQLKECFTSAEFGNFIDMRCQYSFKIYDLLKQYSNMKNKSRKFTIEQFRQILGIEENEYPLYADLKRRAINPAIKEINNLTDLLIDLEEEKERKKVISVTFNVKYKPMSINLTDGIQTKEIIDIIKDKSSNVIILLPKMIQKLISEKGMDKLQYYIDNLDKLNYKTANNPSGFFYDAVINEYQLVNNKKSAINNKIPQANNFTQREYTDEYLESLYENV